MASIEKLFTLVNSLTKSEKRYFRLGTKHQKGTKEYIELFDLLERSPVFNEALHQQLSKSLPWPKIDPARKHLYKVIMKSLRQFESDKDVEAQLMNLLQDARILYNKGLVNLSFTQLEKMKRMAYANEKFLLYTMAAKQEIQYLIRQQFVGIKESDLIEKQSKICEYLKQETQTSRHAALYEILLLRYWKNGIVRSQLEVARLNDLVLEEHFILTKQRHESFDAKQLHLNFQSAYFLMVGEPGASLKVYYDLEKLFQNHQSLWKDSPLYYVHLLDGILNDLRLTESYEEMDYFVERLSSIRPPSESLQVYVKCRIYGHRLNCLIDQKKSDAAKETLEQFGSSFNHYLNSAPTHIRSWLNFVLARAFYTFEEYSSALKCINDVLNQPLSIRSGYSFVLCHLLNIQIRTLQKEYVHLEYAARSLERKLRAERKLHGVESLILKVVKRKIAYKPVADLSETLLQLSKNPFEELLMRDLLLKDWITQVS